MKKTIKNYVFIFCTIFFSSILTSTYAEENPLNNGSNYRNLIVIISDTHLGADLAYSECKKNLPALQNFLEQVRESPNIKELVIGGDLVDEWFVPANIETYKGGTQTDFVKRIANTNKGVFFILNKIIKEGKILVTYVPGNHDIAITEKSISTILPGINQARDKHLGLGTYHPTDYPEIAIEHGHRYNFFCAPDPISNQDIAPGTILPPGYFFTRIATTHVIQKCTESKEPFKKIKISESANESQKLLYYYWKLWGLTLRIFPVNNDYDEKFIVTKVNGLDSTFSVNDILPYQNSPKGKIHVNLYNKIQDTWKQREAINNVPIHIPIEEAIIGSASVEETNKQAEIQYFQNPKSNVRIVVFGHTHAPTITTSTNDKGQKTIYANSGTWIDNNLSSSTTMNFIVIEPTKLNKEEDISKVKVKLYNFENQKFNNMKQDSIILYKL